MTRNNHRAHPRPLAIFHVASAKNNTLTTFTTSLDPGGGGIRRTQKAPSITVAHIADAARQSTARCGQRRLGNHGSHVRMTISRSVAARKRRLPARRGWTAAVERVVS